MSSAPATGAAHGAIDIWTVKPQRIVPRLIAFARVEPISVASLYAGLDGRLGELDLVPGSRVKSRQIIGRLDGTQVRERLAVDRSRSHAAREEEKDLDDALAIMQQRRAQHLATRQDVDHASAAAAQARTLRIEADQQLWADMDMTALRSPAKGEVTAVYAHTGERVHAGQLLAKVQPDNALWLSASLYALDARRTLHVGMHGRFIPDDGSMPIPVRIEQLPPRLHADGGQPVELLPAAGTSQRPTWFSGETGTLRLEGRPRMRILVPTRALILDGGQWWVLLSTSGGEIRRAVTPGSRYGDRTVILHGLTVGAHVVVDNAYLRFHRNIAHHYQVQD